MNERRIDPRKQFSKWLARYGAIIWGIYAFAVLALIAYRPEVAISCVWLTLIMTCNKALDTIQYTKNSVGEKLLLAMIDKTKLELGMKTSEEEKKENQDSPEGESNG